MSVLVNLQSAFRSKFSDFMIFPVIYFQFNMDLTFMQEVKATIVTRLNNATAQ